MPMRFSISCMSLWDSYVSFSQLLGNLHFFAQDTTDKFCLFCFLSNTGVCLTATRCTHFNFNKCFSVSRLTEHTGLILNTPIQ